MDTSVPILREVILISLECVFNNLEKISKYRT